MSNHRFQVLKFIVGIVLFWASFLCGQNDVLALDPAKSLLQYDHDMWRDELPHNTIHALTQTHDGYMWLGTYEGLARFDGVQFTIFNKHNTPELKNNGMRSFCEDHTGRLWIGTLGGGLTCFKNGRFTTYTVKDGLGSDFVFSLCEDRQGTLWIGTGEGLSCFKNGTITTYTKANGLTHNTIYALCLDQDDRLWIGTNGGGLNCFKEGRFTAYTTKEGLLSDIIFSLGMGLDHTVWVGSQNGGLNSFKNGQVGSYTVKDGLPANTVYSILTDHQGCLWIGTEGGGVARLKQGRLETFGVKQGLTHNFVRSLFEDREGSLWIGTNGGLNRFREGKFTNITTNQGLSDNNARTVYEDHQGRFWVGTDYDGLNCLKDGKVTVYTAKDGLINNSIRTICEDQKGNLWIGTNGGGLNCLKDGKFISYTTQNGLAANNVYVVYEDRAANLWIGTSGGSGLNCFKDGTFTTYGKKEGLSNNSVRSLCEDAQGSLWIGTIGGGLNCLKDGKVTAYTTRDGLSSDIVFSIYEDQEKTLWIGTDAGLNRFKNGRFTSYRASQGLFDDVAFSILEDPLGNLWISCNKGIYRVSKKDLDDFDRKVLQSIPYMAYGKADGMGANQCNGSSQPTGWKTKDGKLCFATIGGITIVDPLHINFNRQPPPVKIEQVIVDGQSIEIESPEQSLVLSPGKEKFEFHFTGLSFLVPEKVKFRYKLEGVDKDWVENDTHRRAYYTNLQPGWYRFRVKACNNDGIWNETGDTVAFTLKPYFYQTWWAKLFFVGSGLCLMYGGVRLRLNTLRRRNEMLTLKVRERTAQLDKKNNELSRAIEKLKVLQKETEQKNEALAKKNVELIESQKQADVIFSALADVLPGTVIDNKYRLESKIGSGGFGAVYRATHLALHRLVAVKVLRPSAQNASTATVQRFRMEGISACRINHPNAVAVLDSGISAEGIAYLVMELLEGHPLTTELEERGPLSPARCAEILLPVCDVLAKAHSTGLVHRDIKPDNIFLHQTEAGEVIKVVDFGIAKLLDESGELDFQATETGRIVGTPVFMSPERLNNKPYDGRTDVYSLGIVLYQMLSGRVPFPITTEGLVRVVLEHLTKEPPSLRRTNPHISVAIEKVVMSALAKDPEQRPTAKEFGRAFAEAIGVEPFSIPSGPLPSLTPKTPPTQDQAFLTDELPTLMGIEDMPTLVGEAILVRMKNEE